MTNKTMYLVSTNWRGALNIGDMRLLETPEQVKGRLIELWGVAGPLDPLEDFFANQTWKCRVYEMTLNDSEGPKLMNKKKLKELIS